MCLLSCCGCGAGCIVARRAAPGANGMVLCMICVGLASAFAVESSGHRWRQDPGVEQGLVISFFSHLDALGFHSRFELLAVGDGLEVGGLARPFGPGSRGISLVVIPAANMFSSAYATVTDYCRPPTALRWRCPTRTRWPQQTRAHPAKRSSVKCRVWIWFTCGGCTRCWSPTWPQVENLR